MMVASCSGTGVETSAGAPDSGTETGGSGTPERPRDGVDWPSYGYDWSNSVHNGRETVLSAESVSELVEAWRLDTGGVTGTPIVTDGVAYLGDWRGAVYAVDAIDGTTEWEAQVTDMPITSTVAVTDEVVIAGDLGGVLHAVDRGTRETVWSTNLEPRGASLFASPVVIGDMVVIGMTDTELEDNDPGFRASVVAVNLDDGGERWRLYTDPGKEPGYWVSIWSSAAYDPDRGLIYLGTGNTNQAEGAEDAPLDLPMTDGVMAIEQDTGKVAWFYRLVEHDEGRDLDVGSSPNLFSIGGRDVVGAGGKSGDYVVLDRDTGEEVWKTHLTSGGAGGGVMSTAAIGDGVIYVGSNELGVQGTIFALDAEDGSVLWREDLGGPISGGSMALANGVLYRGTLEGSVTALDADDGSLLWTDDLDSPLGGGFSVAGGRLYVGFGADDPRVRTDQAGGLVAYALAAD